MVDSHCHLEMVEQRIGYNLPTILENFKMAGGKALVTISTDFESLEFLEKGIQQSPVSIYFSSGWHPHEAKHYSNQVEERLRSLARRPNCIAIGEIGLDYFYLHSTKEEQHHAFTKQLELAASLNLPVIIHTRDAEEDTLKVLKDVGYPHVLIHCFTGTLNFAEECWKLGFPTSFSGIITFPKSDDLRVVVKNCPKTLYMIETDSPFLAPVPKRGKVNEPALVRHVGEKVAEIRGISVDQAINESTQNFKKFFFENFGKPVTF